MHIHTSAVRRLRKTARLGQQELANLLDIDQASVSRIEAGGLPDTRTTFALQVLFGELPHALFADGYQMIIEEVVGRAAELDLRLRDERSHSASQKKAWLRQMIARITPLPA